MTNLADGTFRKQRFPRWIPGALGLLLLAGCANVSPQRVNVDRLSYGQVVADSWKRQTLLNIVRLRYADAPVFLEVASIINSYSVGGKANANAEIPNRTDPSVFSVGAEGTWSNTPTVTYQPVLGDRFTKSMLQPIPPVAVFQLLQGGWIPEIVLPLVVNSINGLRNNFAGVGADPEFRELIETLSRIQRAGGFGIRIEPRKDGSAVIIVLGHGRNAAELTPDEVRIRSLLGLTEGNGEFDVSYGLVPRNQRDVAMLTRSMMDIMLQLGFGIDLPAEHVRDGRVLPGRAQTGDEKAKPLVRIHSGEEAPADTYTAVPYKGYWYWIDDTDVQSKRAFTFMLILFSLAETGQGAAAPVVTVPSR